MDRIPRLDLVAADDLRNALNAVEDRLARQRDALVRLTSAQLVDCDRLPRTIAGILEASAAALCVARASLWQFDSQRTGIACTDLYEAESGRHSSGMALRASDYPAYFMAVSASDVVAADDANTDPRTREFSANYLKPLGISSMIDAPINDDGSVIGILCHEHVGPPRTWTSDEKSFVIAISSLLALALERCERRRAETTVALQAAALNAAADATLITDSNGIVVWTNPAFTALTGYEPNEAIGRNPRDLVWSGAHDRAHYETLWATIKAGLVWRGEMTNRRKDGSTYVEDETITPVMSATGEITHFIAVKRDLTEKKKSEAQFLQAQKMEIVGRLAGGVAHDFNNLLTVINGTAELALMDIDERDPLRAGLEQIQEAGARAVALTRQLLAFSRKQVVRRVPVDIGGLLTGFRSILQRLIGADIALQVTCDPSAPQVIGDPGQLEQVILNLVVNARDAMPRGGPIRLEVCGVELDEVFVAAHVDMKAGPHVMLVVEDTGEGMTPDVLARIFEPFFTTKEEGKGTGLGLATVFSIVSQTGGTVCVTSEPGRGTTFRIYWSRVPTLLAAS